MATFTFIFIASLLSASIALPRIRRQVDWSGNNFGNFLPGWQNGASGNNWPSRPGNGFQNNLGSENSNSDNGEQSWTFSPSRTQRPQRPTRPTPTTQPTDTTTPTVVPFLVLYNAPEGCDCPRTGQFNPVCGTDSNTYVNMALLKCYQNCGTRVDLRYQGSCRRSG